MDEHNLDFAMQVYKAAETFVSYLNMDYPTSLFRVNMLSHPQNNHKRLVIIECCGSTVSTEMIDYTAGVNVSDKNIEGRLYFPTALNTDRRFEQAINAYLAGREEHKLPKLKGERIVREYPTPVSEREAYRLGEENSPESIDAIADLATDRTLIPRENVENDFARYNGA